MGCRPFSMEKTFLTKKLEIQTSTTVLETNCVGTEDFTNIFDNEIGLIYFDYAHMGDAGNRIVAEKMFKISSSFVTDIQEQMVKISNI